MMFLVSISVKLCDILYVVTLLLSKSIISCMWLRYLLSKSIKICIQYGENIVDKGATLSFSVAPNFPEW